VRVDQIRVGEQLCSRDKVDGTGYFGCLPVVSGEPAIPIYYESVVSVPYGRGAETEPLSSPARCDCGLSDSATVSYYSPCFYHSFC
jgi:hypothetical protein